MKKIYALLLFGASLVSYNAFSQLSIEPSSVYVNEIAADDFEGIGHSLVYNNTGSNLNLTWERTVIEETEGWSSAVCDLNQCYLAHISSQSFGLGNGASGTMDVHVYPNDIEGGSVIKIDVYQTNDPSNVTSAMYYFNQGVSGIAERLTEAIKVYPNPVQDFINVDDSEGVVKQMEIYNISGKLIKSISSNTSKGFEVSELPAGNYILKMMDADANIVSTNLLVKN